MGTKKKTRTRKKAAPRRVDYARMDALERLKGCDEYILATITNNGARIDFGKISGKNARFVALRLNTLTSDDADQYGL